MTGAARVRSNRALRCGALVRRAARLAGRTRSKRFYRWAMGHGGSWPHIVECIALIGDVSGPANVTCVMPAWVNRSRGFSAWSRIGSASVNVVAIKVEWIFTLNRYLLNK
jgi:hypothetical protein